MSQTTAVILIGALLLSSCTNRKSAMPFSLDYERMIFLDAEDLAEGGIKTAYEELLPELRQYIEEPAEIEEEINDEPSSYLVRYGSTEFLVYSPDLDDEGGESWGRATVVLFEVVNDQLKNTEYRFYAINGGNDLGGMFLTPAQAKAARETLPSRTDWPYIPHDGDSWFGMYH